MVEPAPHQLAQRALSVKKQKTVAGSALMTTFVPGCVAVPSYVFSFFRFGWFGPAARLFQLRG